MDETKWFSWRPYIIKREVSNSNLLLSSAEVLTKSRWRYCYLEIRAKLAGNTNNKGYGQIFWMLNNDDPTKTIWQEIDLLENASGPINNTDGPYGINKMNCTVHCPNQPTAIGLAVNTGIDLSQEYHIYAFEWTPDYITFYFDGTEVNKITSSEICIPNLYCKFIIAQCKNILSPPPDALECWPSTEIADNSDPIMYIDYVRVYQKLFNCSFNYIQ